MITRRKGRWGGPTDSSKREKRTRRARCVLMSRLTKEGHFSSPLESRLWLASAAPQHMSESGPQKKKKSPRVREKLLVPVALTRNR